MASESNVLQNLIMESTADGGGQPDMIWVPSVLVRHKLAQVVPILQSLQWIKTDFHIKVQHPVSFHLTLPDGHNLQFSFARVVK